MEKRVYCLDDVRELIKIRRYLERFYVSKGRCVLFANSRNFDAYHLNLGSGNFSENAISILLDFPGKKVITAGSPGANGTIRTELEDAINETLRTEKNNQI